MRLFPAYVSVDRQRTLKQRDAVPWALENYPMLP
jgi:hypothetical protein